MATADEIAALEAIQNAGAGRVTTDGLTVSFDLDEIRRRLAALRDKADQAKRPRVARINLSTAF